MGAFQKAASVVTQKAPGRFTETFVYLCIIVILYPSVLLRIQPEQFQVLANMEASQSISGAKPQGCPGTAGQNRGSAC